MSRNVSGQAYALTVLTPILDGHAAELTAHLDALPEGDGEPARARARDAPRALGGDRPGQVPGPRPAPARLARARRGCCSPATSTATLDAYLERLRTGLGEDADAIWGHCRGYPGRRARASRAGCKAHQLEAALFFAAYGDQTVEQVHANLDKRARLIEFALEAQGLEPDELKVALPGAVLTELDFPNIQGFVVRGYRLPAAGYLFLRIDDGAKARAFLGDFIPHVITAERWDVKPESGINLAFSYAGLRALGVAEASLAGFPAEFRDGMASRARAARRRRRERARALGGLLPQRRRARAGDDQRQGPGGARRARPADPRAGRRAAAAPSVVVTQLGGVLPTGREHFGYADGFSQPAIEGSRFEDHPGAGAPGKNGDWRPIAAGEFILGYPDEQGSLPAAPAPDELEPQRLLRRLPQAAPGRRRASGASCAEAAELYPGGEELLAAKLVGRWRDGTPLDSSPHARGRGAGGRQVAQQRVRLRRATRTGCAARSARTSAA